MGNKRKRLSGANWPGGHVTFDGTPKDRPDDDIEIIKAFAETAVQKDEFSEAKKETDTKLNELSDKLDELDENAKKFAATFGAPGGAPATVKGYGDDGYGLSRFAADVVEYDSGRNPGDLFTAYRAKTVEELGDAARIHFASGVVNTGIPQEGGALIPKPIATSIKETVMDNTTFMDRTDTLTMTTPTLEFPVEEIDGNDEDSIANGMRLYWEKEINSGFTASQPLFGTVKFELNMLGGIVKLTDKMIRFSPTSMDAYLRRKFAIAFAYKMEKAILRGTGSGMPEGILNADVTESAAKETGQAADTIVVENLEAMTLKMLPQMQGNAVFLAHPSTKPQLNLMTLAVGTGGSAIAPSAMTTDANGLTSYRGIPIIFTQHCSKLGDVGDIILADLSQYAKASTSLEFAESIHLYFDKAQTALRALTYAEGRPWVKDTITDENDTSLIYSPFVTLAERA